MKSKILPILISNILVAGIVWYAASGTGSDSEALAGKDAEIRMLKDELAKRNNRSSRSNRPARQNAETRAAESSDPSSEETREARRRQMTQRFENFRRVRTNAAISRLSLRLNLTEEQTARLQAISEERSAEIQAVMEALREARESGADTDELGTRMRELMRANNPEEYITDLLSDEQKSEYAAYRNERATARTETVTNMRLSMIQEAVPLNQEQKDKYFAEYAAAAMNSENSRVDPETEEKILRGILSEDQWKVYSEQQQAMEALGGPGAMRGNRGGPPMM